MELTTPRPNMQAAIPAWQSQPPMKRAGQPHEVMKRAGFLAAWGLAWLQQHAYVPHEGLASPLQVQAQAKLRTCPSPPLQCAPAYVFLASEDASYFTGGCEREISTLS